MDNFLHPVRVDTRTTFTKEEIAAKMIGWMRNATRNNAIKVNEHGLSTDQMMCLPFIEASLEEQLNEICESARRELIDALEKYVDTEEPSEVKVKDTSDILEEKRNIAEAYKRINDKITQKIAIVVNSRELAVRARNYLIDIEEELAKGDSSILKIDRATTDKFDIIYLTLISAAEWAHKKYGISIDDSLSPQPSDQDQPGLPQENETSPEGEFSKTKAKNLYTTFAFLVEGFAEKAPKYRKNGEVNITAIAKELEKLASTANKGEKLSGQSSEAIKSCIEEALKIKKSKLPKK
ncbi:MAG: hypothetical protein K0U41_04510 [Gammaproteobacteria bacterium]|nr:hypothetical protein [Gammaproteobacteria bacterium]